MGKEEKQNTKEEKRISSVSLGANTQLFPKHMGLDEALLRGKMSKIWEPLPLLNFFFSRELPVLSKLCSHRKSRAGKRRLTPAHLGTRWEGSSATWQHPPSLPRPKDTSGEKEQFPCQLLCNYSSKNSAASEANKHWTNQQETPLHQPLALGREELKHSTCESREGGLEDTLRLSSNKTRRSGLCH